MVNLGLLGLERNTVSCIVSFISGLPFLSGCVPKLQMDLEVPLSRTVGPQPCVHLSRTTKHDNPNIWTGPEKFNDAGRHSPLSSLWSQYPLCLWTCGWTCCLCTCGGRWSFPPRSPPGPAAWSGSHSPSQPLCSWALHLQRQKKIKIKNDVQKKWREGE